MNPFTLKAGPIPVFFLAAGVFAAENPPPGCQGTEAFRFAVQVSVDGGSTWTSDLLRLCLYPGSSVDVAVRTLLTVTSGETQGWSLGLRHQTGWPLGYGGGISLSGVTINGTDAATVQDGSAPDLQYTSVRSGGFTQGVLIDTDLGISLRPVSDFVTARACYRVTAPYYYGTYSASLTFTHDLGDPPIRTVVSQDGVSQFPCVENLTLSIKVGYCYSRSPPSCSLPSEPYSSEPPPAGAEGGEGGPPADPEAVDQGEFFDVTDPRSGKSGKYAG